MIATRPDWDFYFVAGAEWVATRADCRRRQHGALIVDEHHRIVGTGYNGAPAGAPGCLSGNCPRGLLTYDQLKTFSSYDDGPGRCISVHAEQNAIMYAGIDKCRGATIYITGEPCKTCRRLIAGAGIARMVWRGENGRVVDEFI
jgi:dCMP deaminase